jgi:hypothetical protein
LALCLCGFSEKISFEINRARIHEKQDAGRKQQDENRTSGRGADIIILDDPIKADDAQSDRQTGLKVRSDPHGDRTHVTFELPGYGRALWKPVQLRVGMLGTTRRACLSPDA